MEEPHHHTSMQVDTIRWYSSLFTCLSLFAFTDRKMLILAFFRRILFVLCLILEITRGQVHKKENRKHCMSTYSFTVAESDHMKCSHQGAGKTPPPKASSGGTIEATITRRLLAAVQKLVQHNNHLNEAKTAKDMVKELTDTMQHQEDEMKQLVHRMGQLQNQLLLLTSGRRDENADDKPLFTGFSGVTNQYLGCPVHHTRRIHEMAPVRYKFDQLVRLVPRSCYEWRRNGHTQTGTYLIDPDGVDGLAPFTVECRMLEPEGSITVIHHDHEGRNRVVGHEAPGSLQVVITYPGVDPEHQTLIVDSSHRCWQYLNWECRGAVITKKTWWVGRDGHKATYWAGGDPVKGGCFCNTYDGCRGGNICNCDTNDDRRYLQDGGNITDSAVLPVSQLYIGDTGGHNEEGFYTLGPLECYSTLSNPTGDSNAFIPVIIHPPFDGFCDYDGWLIIQRRFHSGSLHFNRTWQDYKHGFGDITAEHWLGLEKVHHLTSQNHTYTLSFSFDVGKGIKFYAQYDNFIIASENDGYAVYVGQYNGTAGNSLLFNNGTKFSTKDRDNDAVAKNCADDHHGGWWFSRCDHGNPNSEQITWQGLTPIKEVEIKIKPTNYL